MYLIGGGFVVAQMKLSIKKTSHICFKRGGGQLDGCTIKLVHEINLHALNLPGVMTVFSTSQKAKVIYLPKIIKVH